MTLKNHIDRLKRFRIEDISHKCFQLDIQIGQVLETTVTL